MKGAIYLVGTPIGNISDITKRAIETLHNVDFIYCEDTRVSRKLLTHYNIKTTLLTYHLEKMTFKFSEIINHLDNGKNIAIISDAGLPLISDPGYEIVKYAKENKIKVIPVGGVSAHLMALISSGLITTPHLFLGFLDRKEEKIKKELIKYYNFKGTIIILESPKRVLRTLEYIKDVFGDVMSTYAREITKKYEEIKTDKITNLITELKKKDQIKGEFVILFYNNNNEENKNSPKEVYHKYLMMGLLPKEALKVASLELKISKNELYKIIHKE